MAAKRINYQIVGRYMNGKEVTGYHLQSIETGKSGKFTREQTCYLVGRGQITNCTAQPYKDQIILRGNGMSLDDLPIINEDGELKNSDGLGKVRRGTSAMEALEMYNIVGVVKAGRTIAGYVLQNAGCGIKKFKRAEVLEMAKAGKIGNARVQMSNGREILRGIDCKLDELPTEKITNQDKNTTALDVENVKQNKIDKSQKVETSKLISISQLYYKGNGRFEVTLVDFGASNSTISRTELIEHLEKFKAEVKRVIGHNFYNTDDILEVDIEGKNYLYTFDDPYYTSIEEYAGAAKKLGAKFYIDNYVTIFDENCDELSDEIETKARQELTLILRKI